MNHEEIKDHPGFFEKLRAALGFYGFVYIIFLAILVAMGYIYMRNINMITGSKYQAPQPVSDTLKQVTADLPVKKGSITPPIDVFALRTASPEMIAKGQELYKTNCSSCHGDQGMGNGPAGATLNPPPRNFTILTGWTNGPTIDQMYKTLHDGITARGMASFANIPPAERFSIIHYVRSFSQFPPIDDVQLKKIDEMYSLSQGVKEPNQIPVKMAIEKILAENSPRQEKINTISKTIAANNTDTAAVILKSITSDINKAVTVLAGNPKWNESEAEFVSFIITGSTEKGFKGEAADLTREQATRIYTYLKGLFAQFQI
jgi:mono/diheme cytochrome c family protein